ncbi:CitMHS family transporter [Caproiciproducens faecalis]|uniref:Citrate transporter n=1 Tax=Caproiciproducens faecalis TaxID=2820301 RepID=A0ABS7DQ47_9FIRM|nr:citrate:proton symporter [Caproiciproducens faecalis]MBW7572686.1 citrate transporter [Caproiciproducens faecalis]
MLTALAWVMIILFMVMIMTKKMHPFTAIVLIPLSFTFIGTFTGLYREAAAKASEIAIGDVTYFDQLKLLGTWVQQGLTKTSTTIFMMFFAIMFFSLMLDTGLFDPISKTVIKIAKGDPLKVIVGTGIITALVSLSGDGTTTTLICCSALVPIYKKLNLKRLYLGVILVLMNTILNILPWSSPTARVMSVLDGIDPQQMLYALAPGMAVAIVYMMFVCYYLGLKERKRLGIQSLTDQDITELMTPSEEKNDAKRPKMMLFNGILTFVVLVLLIAGVFQPVFIFLVGSVIALVVNYPSIEQQKERIRANSADMVMTVVVVMGAGVFAGLFSGSGMADALAASLIQVIPASFGPHWAFITSFISIPGGFFLSNDAFFYGVVPVLARAGVQYGFNNFQMGVACLMGQAFHLLSPFTPWIYLLLGMTGLEIGDWQKEGAKWAIGIFISFIVLTVLTGYLPVTLHP